MPLVTVTTSKRYYPTTDQLHNSTDEEQLTAILVSRLPKLIADLAEELSLEEDTPEDAVLVDIKQFHPLAQNAPDLSVYMAFSEVIETKEARLSARDALVIAIEQLFNDNGSPQAGWSLDLVWGPSHGFYQFVGSGGKTVEMAW